MVEMLPSAEREYLSFDTVSKSSDTVGDINLLYPTEFLNSLKINNFLEHRIILKVGVPIMLLRNLNQSAGLCNGTRLMVTNLADRF
jgi:ATP-dependent DNA helicase PIF1